MNIQKNKREKSIEFWAQPKLRLLGKNWSFYTKKSYVIKSNISLATTMLLKNNYWLNKL